MTEEAPQSDPEQELKELSRQLEGGGTEIQEPSEGAKQQALEREKAGRGDPQNEG